VRQHRHQAEHPTAETAQLPNPRRSLLRAADQCTSLLNPSLRINEIPSPKMSPLLSGFREVGLRVETVWFETVENGEILLTSVDEHAATRKDKGITASVFISWRTSRNGMRASKEAHDCSRARMALIAISALCVSPTPATNAKSSKNPRSAYPIQRQLPLEKSRLTTHRAGAVG
jgi:hypothetical protein